MNTDQKNKGVIVFALGHPQYGRLAFNLAVSIKAMEDIPIAVVHDSTGLAHLSEAQVKLFDMVIPCDLEAGCGAKLHAYEFSPFDHTLLLDADMVWLPRRMPSELFKELEGVEFTGITEGDTDNPSGQYFFWADVAEVKEKYGVQKMHQWRTEVLYFEKSDKVEKMFKDAIDIHSNHGLSTVKKFAEGVPDEMSINISAGMNDIEPHLKRWQPSYWPQMFANRIPEVGTLYRDYYLLSAGGNHTTDNVKQLYNNIIKAQAPKLSLTHSFPLQSKYNFLSNRRKS